MDDERTEGYVYVYHAKPLHYNLSFARMSIELTAPSRLKRREGIVCGSDFNSPFLATGGGLEHPLAIYADNKLLSFHPELKFFECPEDGLGKDDEIEWYQRRRAVMGDSSLPDEFAHGHFSIWALNQYPAPDRRIWRKAPLDHPVFAPETTLEVLTPHVIDTYRQLLKYDPSLKDHKPIVLAWYTSNNHIRLATRPNRIVNKIRGPLCQRSLTIATTLEQCVIHK